MVSSILGTPAVSATEGIACRSCGNAVRRPFVDLGLTPIANRLARDARPPVRENVYPLKALVCDNCFLVQVPVFESPQSIFDDYPYFSSTSSSWVVHARRYTDQMIRRFALTPRHRVIEVASNDGYLLQFFKAKEFPVLGIEPAETVAKAAVANGVPTLVRFFGNELAKDLATTQGQADLLVANNVLAHVPDLHGFVSGLSTLLAPQGVLTIEVPHLLRLMERVQFDTIYHEHFSYFSLLSATRILESHDLKVFDVEELPTHGGSLRLYVCHRGADHQPTGSVERILKQERAAGLEDPRTYDRFQADVEAVKHDLLSFLRRARSEGKRVAAYGAPAKATTLLNFCGIGPDLLPFAVDRSPAKQGRFIPGVQIPIHAPDRIRETRPDYVLILPWNLKEEIMQQNAFIREWGGKFVLPAPRVQVMS